MERVVIEKFWDEYLIMLGVTEGQLGINLKTDLKRAFFAGFLNSMDLVCNQLGQIESDDEIQEHLNDIHEQIVEFWEFEKTREDYLSTDDPTPSHP